MSSRWVHTCDFCEKDVSTVLLHDAMVQFGQIAVIVCGDCAGTKTIQEAKSIALKGVAKELL